MKQLDEVIKANECCDHGDLDSRCEDCPYSGIGACCRERETDSLHYLKTIETTENLYHNAINELSKLKTEDWKDRCLPLTWDELKQMFHRPVWIETTAKKGWNIIVSIDSADMQVIHTAHREPKLSGFSKADLGKTWQAYRKERK